MIGEMYLEGVRVRQDVAKALALVKAAVDGGSADALAVLGTSPSPSFPFPFPSPSLLLLLLFLLL